MRILVYEFVSGGGYAEDSLPSSVLSEGFSMLRGLTADFKAAGHSVATVLDSRLAAFNPPLEAECEARVTSRAASEEAFETAAKSAEAAYVIAPESGGLLRTLVEKIEKIGMGSLNCTSSAISTAANKLIFLEHAKHLGLSTPKSLVFRVGDRIDEITESIKNELGFPAIVKPVDGVSCSGLSIVSDRRQVERAVEKLKATHSSEVFLAQEDVVGEAASVSLFSTDNEALPVTLNRQNISLNTPRTESSYDGGIVPSDSPSKQEVFSIAKKAAKSIPGLRGYIGVDLVLTKEMPVVIEVNPRLTTSYIGLRMVSGFNPAQALIDSALERKLPVDCETFGYSSFVKVKTRKPKKDLLFKTYGLTGVFAPPFPISRDRSAFAMVTSHGETLQTALSRLEKNRNTLLTTLDAKGE